MDSNQYSFTEVYRHTAPSTCQFSPGTTFFAVAVEDHIIVRVTATMQLVRTWACGLPNSNTQSNRIELKQLSWSPDSSYLLACAPKSGCTWVFGVADADDKPRAVIQSGIEGLLRAEWSPSSKEVLCFSDQRLRLSIHNLVDGRGSYIENFKSPSGCHAYRQDKRYLAIAEKHKGKEVLSIYDAGDMYNLIRSFPLATQDVQGVSWSPCGRWLAVWDDRLNYAIHVYSPLGPLLSSFNTSSPSFVGPDPGLGVRTVSWGPGGQWLGIGGYDGKVRIVEADGWRCMCTLDPGRRKGSSNLSTWREPPNWSHESESTGPIALNRTGQQEWPTVLQDPSRPHENMGISQVGWNPDGSCLMIRSDAVPSIVQIYSYLVEPTGTQAPVIRLRTVVSLSQSIKQARWNPSRSQRLAIIGLPQEENLRGMGSGVFIWDGEWEDEDMMLEPNADTAGIAEVLPIPMASFDTHDIRWAPDGETLCIIDRSQFCMLREFDSGNRTRDQAQELTTITE